MVRKELSATLDAWLAYTISRSQMRQNEGFPWVLAPQDRTHTLTAVFAHRWRGWLSSARFRYTTGPLYTPVTGAIIDTSTDRYLPVFGAQNSARMRAFMQADLRFGREIHVGDSVGSVFFDITNITSRQNSEAILFSPDYAKNATLSTPPRTYLLGVRWQR
jgi:hypothetical protein